MTREDALNGVQDIFRDIFDKDAITIEGKTSSGDIEEWDSLNHISLISSIQKEFNVKFSLIELMSLKDVDSIINLIQEKSK